MLERGTIERSLSPLLSILGGFSIGIAAVQARAVKRALEAGDSRAEVLDAGRAEVAALAASAKREAEAALKVSLAGLIGADISHQLALFRKGYERGILRAAPVLTDSIRRASAMESAKNLLFVRENLNRVALYGGSNLADILDMAIADKLAGVPLEKVTLAAARLIREEGISIRLPGGQRIHDEIAYVRRHLVTMVSQDSSERQREIFDAQDIDPENKWVETSSHWGARPDHEIWQGRVFTSWAEFVASTGYGDVAGICGINCRHTWYPFIPGVSVQRFFPKPHEENAARYNDMQAQRYIEAKIREWKTAAAINAELGLDDGKAAAKVREWQARMREHIKESGLTRHYEREAV